MTANTAQGLAPQYDKNVQHSEIGDRAGRLGVEHIVDERAVDRLIGHGLLQRDGNVLRTTGRGRLLLDSILAEIAA